MNKIIILFALAFSLNTYSQERIYLTKGGMVVNSAAEATWYKTVFNDGLTGRAVETAYKIGDTLISKVEYSNYENRTRDGKTEYYSPQGWITFKSEYKNNLRNGEMITYWDKNTIRRIEHYLADKMIDGKCFDQAGNEIPYFPGEVKPEYPGGNQKLYSDIASNFKAKGKAQGKIIVQFVIEKDGSVTDVAIRQGINSKLDKEAIRVIQNLGKWTPGSQEGRPVRVMYTLPINVAR